MLSAQRQHEAMQAVAIMKFMRIEPITDHALQEIAYDLEGGITINDVVLQCAALVSAKRDLRKLLEKTEGPYARTALAGLITLLCPQGNTV